MDKIRTTQKNGQELKQMVQSCVPPLKYSKHKGQDGRIATIGGCREYTGAPYFAASSAFKIGCDLSHVYCTKDAAPVIKSYSPELIVHPDLDSDDAAERINAGLKSKHAVVIGPGLGREDSIIDVVKKVIEVQVKSGMPLVLDADGVYLLNQCPNLIKGYTKAILTPNIVEFKHLFRTMLGRDPSPDDIINDTVKLSEALGNVTICQKGRHDIITDGNNVLICDEEGSPRRCGGQGDILSGTMGVLSFWTHQAYADNSTDNHLLKLYGPTLSAAYGACLLTRRCAQLSFKKLCRSTTTSAMLLEVAPAFQELFETYFLK